MGCTLKKKTNNEDKAIGKRLAPIVDQNSNTEERARAWFRRVEH